MYSLVLMAALTTGGEAPAGHWFHGCCGGGCSGWSCHGCYGCSGCCGGCTGCCGGCYGSCYGGCHGSCHGCSGCYGTVPAYSCYGCYGSCYGGCYGSCNGCGGCGYVVPAAPVMGTPPVMQPVPTAPAKRAELNNSAPTAQARMIVEVPADAKLFVDDQLMKSESERRVFNTPALDRSQQYYYIIRAEVVRDGKTYSETKMVIVRAGEMVRMKFPELEERLASLVQGVASR